MSHTDARYRFEEISPRAGFSCILYPVSLHLASPPVLAPPPLLTCSQRWIPPCPGCRWPRAAPCPAPDTEPGRRTATPAEEGGVTTNKGHLCFPPRTPRRRHRRRRYPWRVARGPPTARQDQSNWPRPTCNGGNQVLQGNTYITLWAFG